MAGLQVGQALGCCGCLGLGSAVLVPQVPGHSTSICNKGCKYISFWAKCLNFIVFVTYQFVFHYTQPEYRCGTKQL